VRTTARRLCTGSSLALRSRAKARQLELVALRPSPFRGGRSRMGLAQYYRHKSGVFCGWGGTHRRWALTENSRLHLLPSTSS
jgi:hypothetical protein